MTNLLLKYKPISLAFMLAFAFVLMGFNTLANRGWSLGNLTFNNSSDKKLSENKKQKYRKDATRLALRLISDNGEYYDLEAKVPEQEVSSIYNALVSIHESDLAEAKVVTRMHKLHTFPVPSVDQFFVVYDRTAEWAIPLRLGDMSTDSEEINNLIAEYGLVIDKHVEWDEQKNSFHIKATRSLNIAAIAKEFSKVEGVVLTDLLMPDGDGNDIEVEQVGNNLEIRFLVKFGSCITGCKSQHIWTFQVSDQNEVSFINESGDELPDWMK